MASNNVQLRGLVQKFGRTEILHGLDMDVDEGVLGILGPNGAGKTTLLRTLATSIRPTSGAVNLFGLDPANAQERRTIRHNLGYLPQNFGYYPNFTVSDFVEYFALLKEMPHKEIEAAVSRAIEGVGLLEHANSKLKTLSGGMLRRAGIAQAVVNNPKLLLLDEPTAGLDPEQRVAFRELIRELSQNSTVILSTHLVEDVGAACADIALLSGGNMIFRGTPLELRDLGQSYGASGDTPLERGYSAAIGGKQ